MPTIERKLIHDEVERFERVAGVDLPELLKSLYMEIGNGGFGPVRNGVMAYIFGKKFTGDCRWNGHAGNGVLNLGVLGIVDKETFHEFIHKVKYSWISGHN